MTLLYETKSKSERYFSSELTELEEIESKTPQEAHQSIVKTLMGQQKIIDILLMDNQQLWDKLQRYEEVTTPKQTLVQKIWDNKEDEFWDTF